ncbi:unnamed protein product [Acanthoscelides obtectus]|uniref:Uncharacterized protein n=1 Tax=Acanthoscelides obtectus TaxID=200917 RepID=A0A9P0PQZ7_ACAOB|nr:unnamed protein product [Acanthoscelides obtectus]CAK1640337.1 hypothetical protein AOBTE_LOCUS11661 [Acanthoscelides obtectus]
MIVTPVDLHDFLFLAHSLFYSISLLRSCKLSHLSQGSQGTFFYKLIVGYLLEVRKNNVFAYGVYHCYL